MEEVDVGEADVDVAETGVVGAEEEDVEEDEVATVVVTEIGTMAHGRRRTRSQRHTLMHLPLSEHM